MPCGKCSKARKYIPSKLIRERLAEVERRIEAKKKARLEITYTVKRGGVDGIRS